MDYLDGIINNSLKDCKDYKEDSWNFECARGRMR